MTKASLLADAKEGISLPCCENHVITEEQDTQ
jgi:hypothetical protein